MWESLWALLPHCGGGKMYDCVVHLKLLRRNEDALLPNTLPLQVRVFIVPWMFERLDRAPHMMFAEGADA